MTDQTTRRKYDRIAKQYDTWVGQRQTTQIKRIYPHINRPIRTPILDIGSGTGLLTRELELSVIAIDISEEMLRLNNGIRCIADWAELPFSDAAFGTVFSISALETETGLSTLPKLSEMVRVMKDGGQFYITVLKTEDLYRVQRELSTLGLRDLERYDAEDAMLFCGTKGKQTP